MRVLNIRTLLENLDHLITIILVEKLKMSMFTHSWLSFLFFHFSLEFIFCCNLKSTSSVLHKKHLVEGTETHSIHCKLIKNIYILGRSRGTGDIHSTEFHSSKSSLLREGKWTGKTVQSTLTLLLLNFLFSCYCISLCIHVCRLAFSTVWQSQLPDSSGFSFQAGTTKLSVFNSNFHFPGG